MPNMDQVMCKNTMDNTLVEEVRGADDPPVLDDEGNNARMAADRNGELLLAIFISNFGFFLLPVVVTLC